MKSTNLNQLDAFAIPARAPGPVTDGVIFAQPDFNRALALSQSIAGLEDKEVYGPLKIDPGLWSRISSGSAHFPMHRYPEYRQIVGNDVLLKWIANRCGYELKPLASDLERRLAQAEADLAEERRKNEIIVRFVRETQG